MAGYCVVEALRDMGVQRIALNSVYYWPDWRDGYARFLREAGFDLVYFGNFHDIGFFKTQQEVNDCTWIFDGELAANQSGEPAYRGPDHGQRLADPAAGRGRGTCFLQGFPALYRTPVE